MEILVVILIFITGIGMGLYYSSQLEEGINKNIGCCCKKEKELNKTIKEELEMEKMNHLKDEKKERDNYESFVKKHYKKRK